MNGAERWDCVDPDCACRYQHAEGVFCMKCGHFEAASSRLRVAWFAFVDDLLEALRLRELLAWLERKVKA